MKRKTFEELLQSEFRWPILGDAPFVAAADYRENANISKDNFTRLVFMMQGYKKAADLMVEQTCVEPTDRDLLVCPIIFNYRQFLELSLKYVIATYGPAVAVRPVWRSHDLVKLWRFYAEVTEKYGTTDPDEADSIVEQVVAEFAKIDPGSYSHRYPVDTTGKPIPIAYSDLHLPTLKDVMDGVASYFAGCDGYLSHLKDASP